MLLLQWQGRIVWQLQLIVDSVFKLKLSAAIFRLVFGFTYLNNKMNCEQRKAFKINMLSCGVIKMEWGVFFSYAMSLLWMWWVIGGLCVLWSLLSHLGWFFSFSFIFVLSFYKNSIDFFHKKCWIWIPYILPCFNIISMLI